jgi:NTE family protein
MSAARIAFVLVGGGSLGAVQVGMLQALSEAGVEPDLVVGTSAGAVNAAWVAGHGTSPGSLASLAVLWTQVRRRDLFPVSARCLARALTGRSRALSSGDALGALVRERAGIRLLEEAVVPVHVMACDLLTGLPVALQRGRLDQAVLASAAIPGIYPPVLVGGRWLVDGGVAHGAGVEQTLATGATEVYVLPTGYPCALRRPPTTALGVALHAASLLVHQRLLTEVATAGRADSADPADSVTVHVLPPLCPLAVSAADFTHAAELTERGRAATLRWLSSRGPDRPHQERVLSLHEHHPVASSAAGAVTATHQVEPAS